jgi:prepilin-type processing-associated H-X9-DG protein
MSAAEYSGKSLTESPGYLDVRSRLNAPEQISGMTYMDLPKLAPLGYSGLLATSRLLLGLGDLGGMDSPAEVLPRLDQLMPELSPSGSVSWSDKLGFHARSRTPFPGAEGLSSGDGSQLSIGDAAFAISILLPSLNRARETANRIKCAQNMHMIGMNILLYSNDNHGNFPPDLGTLAVNSNLPAAAYICPDDPVQAPANLPPDQLAAWVNEHSSYIYLGKGLTTAADPTTLVLYEKPRDHRDGSNMLFADGHVEFQNLRLALPSIERRRQQIQSQQAPGQP